MNDGWQVCSFKGPLQTCHFIKDAPKRPNITLSIIVLAFTLYKRPNITLSIIVLAFTLYKRPNITLSIIVLAFTLYKRNYTCTKEHVQQYSSSYSGFPSLQLSPQLLSSFLFFLIRQSLYFVTLTSSLMYSLLPILLPSPFSFFLYLRFLPPPFHFFPFYFLVLLLFQEICRRASPLRCELQRWYQSEPWRCQSHLT